MTPDEEPPNPTLDSKVGKKLAPMSGGTHDQQSRATRLNPVVPANSEQHEDKYVAVDSGDGEFFVFKVTRAFTEKFT